MERNLSAKLDDGLFEVLLETTVSDEEEKVFVNVKGRAVFSTRQENMDILEKIQHIMFPYIRSYISSITTQPGMSLIVLPAMNIVAMVNDQKKYERALKNGCFFRGKNFGD